MITICIVDDHSLFRQGMKMILEEVLESSQIIEASNGAEFLELLKKHSPNLVLMDIRMPVMDGVEATRLALLRNPSLRIAALSMFEEKVYYDQIIDAGAIGFLNKNCEVEELEQALYILLKGESFVSPKVMKHIMAQQKEDEEDSSLLKLSKREREVLQAIAEGLSNHEIGEKLFLSPRTVERHRANLLEKTQSKNSISLILFAIKHNLVRID